MKTHPLLMYYALNSSHQVFLPQAASLKDEAVLYSQTQCYRNTSLKYGVATYNG